MKSPRAVEALLVVSCRSRSGAEPRLRDIVEWLGINDIRARKILAKLESVGLVRTEGGRIEVTSDGWRVVEQLEKILNVKVGADIASVIKAVRKKHVFHKRRSVGSIRSPEYS